MSDTLHPGSRCNQFFCGQLVRIVEVIEPGETETFVRACFGPLAGMEYMTKTANLRKI